MCRLSVSLVLKLKYFLCSAQEALEVRNPRFISRSQERLKKLEHMAQQRRAQRKENPGQKQAPLPVRASKKQFTVPHPLSGEPGGWGGWGRGGGGRGAALGAGTHTRGGGLSDAAAHTAAMAPRTQPQYYSKANPRREMTYGS